MASTVALLGFFCTAAILGQTMATRQLAISNVLMSASDITAAASASGITSASNLNSCGIEIPGWEKQSSTFPVGTLEPYFAPTIAVCTAACAENSYRCAAVLWQDEKVMPLSGAAKCQFVSEIGGFKTTTRQGVDLYSPCNTGCGSKVGGYEAHFGTLPVGVWSAYFADSVEGCAEACSKNVQNCVAAIWEDSQAFHQSDDARCQLVSILSGYTSHMPRGVDLYVRCSAN